MFTYTNDGAGSVAPGSSVIGMAPPAFERTASFSSQMEADEADRLSQATSHAMAAARSIIMSGGTQATALYTAKAAAQSSLVQRKPSVDNAIMLKRFRSNIKAKRQADLVASMALLSVKQKMIQEEQQLARGSSSVTGDYSLFSAQTPSASNVMCAKTNRTASTEFSSSSSSSTCYYQVKDEPGNGFAHTPRTVSSATPPRPTPIGNSLRKDRKNKYAALTTKNVEGLPADNNRESEMVTGHANIGKPPRRRSAARGWLHRKTTKKPVGLTIIEEVKESPAAAAAAAPKLDPLDVLISRLQSAEEQQKYESGPKIRDLIAPPPPPPPRPQSQQEQARTGEHDKKDPSAPELVKLNSGSQGSSSASGTGASKTKGAETFELSTYSSATTAAAAAAAGIHRSFLSEADIELTTLLEPTPKNEKRTGLVETTKTLKPKTQQEPPGVLDVSVAPLLAVLATLFVCGMDTTAHSAGSYPFEKKKESGPKRHPNYWDSSTTGDDNDYVACIEYDSVLGGQSSSIESESSESSEDDADDDAPPAAAPKSILGNLFWKLQGSASHVAPPVQNPVIKNRGRKRGGHVSEHAAIPAEKSQHHRGPVTYHRRRRRSKRSSSTEA